MSTRLDSKCFNNNICKTCIRNNINKYGSFSCDCTGITVEEDVKLAIKEGYSEEDARWLFDAVYFFELIYGKKVRHYQKRILYCTSKKLAVRQCRQTGKTLLTMFRIFHYVMTNDDVSVLVVTPQEVQIKKIWDEYIFRDFVYKNARIKESMTGKSMSPSYKVSFDNGSSIMLMIAGPGVRGQTANWIYMDEAAIIGKDILADVLMAIASKEEESSIIMTSTPKGRGNPFYDACKVDADFNEFHTSIYDVEEMKGQIQFFKKLLGETGFKQEAEAEFPDASGGPYNYRGIDLSRIDYEYEDQIREPGWIYFGGADWNGPNIGTFFYIIGFDPDRNIVKIFDKQVVSSAVWNSTVAKDTFIKLNRKWLPKHWMVDYGYSHDLVEQLRLWSIQVEQDKSVLPGHPDAQIKHTLEPVNFGSWIEIEDPFTREIQLKSTKSFIVSQVSRLFEPTDNYVPVQISSSDQELTSCLENFKLINITAKGTEQYGFDKKSGIEDHPHDAFSLAVYGIVKYYGELFKKIVAESVPLYAQEIFSVNSDNGGIIKVDPSQSIILLTDNSPEAIYIDERKTKKFEPRDDDEFQPVVTRTFSKTIEQRNVTIPKRSNYIVSRILPF